jgi:hypothetical protein
MAHRFQKGNTFGFRKGVSGNPAGKPKEIVEVAKLAREHTVLAIETLVEIAEKKDATDAARVSASEALLNRGWGKPPATINHTSDKPKRPMQELLAFALREAGRIADAAHAESKPDRGPAGNPAKGDPGSLH